MIGILHLLWIIPLAFLCGFITAAIFSIDNENEGG